MNTYKAYKLRIYPKDSQRKLIEKTFGSTRYIYNNFLKMDMSRMWFDT